MSPESPPSASSSDDAPVLRGGYRSAYDVAEAERLVLLGLRRWDVPPGDGEDAEADEIDWRQEWRTGGLDEDALADFEMMVTAIIRAVDRSLHVRNPGCRWITADEAMVLSFLAYVQRTEREAAIQALGAGAAPRPTRMALRYAGSVMAQFARAGHLFPLRLTPDISTAWKPGPSGKMF